MSRSANAVFAFAVAIGAAIVIAPQIPNMTTLEAMMVVSAFLVAAAVIAQFSPNTRGRHYEEISP